MVALTWWELAAGLLSTALWTLLTLLLCEVLAVLVAVVGATDVLTIGAAAVLEAAVEVMAAAVDLSAAAGLPRLGSNADVDGFGVERLGGTADGDGIGVNRPGGSGDAVGLGGTRRCEFSLKYVGWVALRELPAVLAGLPAVLAVLVVVVVVMVGVVGRLAGDCQRSDARTIVIVDSVTTTTSSRAICGWEWVVWEVVRGCVRRSIYYKCYYICLILVIKCFHIHKFILFMALPCIDMMT